MPATGVRNHTHTLGNRLMWLAQGASLLATGWFIWAHSVMPRLGREGLAGVTAEALAFVWIVWICAALITLCVYLVVSLADISVAMRASIRSSAPAMWFAPAIILLSAPSAVFGAAGLILVVNTARLLVTRWAPLDAPPGPAHGAMRRLFGRALVDSAFLSRGSVTALMGACAIQAGAVALLWDYALLAAAFFAASGAILTSLAMVAGAYEPARAPALPHAGWSPWLTFLLAVALSVGGMQLSESAARPGLGAGAGGGSAAFPNLRAMLRRFLHLGQAGSRVEAQKPVVKPYPAPDNSEPIRGGDFPGVVLWPEVAPQVRLVAPLIARGSGAGAVPARRWSIPFSGQYWIFRPPYMRPPLSSLSRRGSPLRLSFKTTDGRPLEMEARQKLDPPFDPRCCGSLEVTVRSGDGYAGTVALEAVLIESAWSRAESLGRQRTGLKADAAGRETLVFRIPAVTGLDQCDEIKVVFHRDRVRADRSARMEVEEFVLAPAGG